MRVDVKFKPNKKNIKVLEKAIKAAFPETLEAMKTEINNMQVVPKETGNLEESVKTGVEGNKGYISYNTPYARRLYFNPQYNFRTDKNPNAQGRWLDTFIHGPKRQWLVQTFAELMRRHSQGVIRR
ncbi:MAG TPA: hypothetical protein GX514_09110 [Thermoanaerobacterales bacterium]|nr:hypothetical protein [Thermoanaerobacterales bacterium]